MADAVDGAVATAEPVKDAPKPEAAKPEAATPAARPKPSLETFTGVDWTKFKDEEKAALQAEIDRRFNVARENAARRAKKETEAFYKGRESVKPAAEPQRPVAEAMVEKAPERGDIDPETGEVQTYEKFLERKADFIGSKSGRAAYEKAQKEAKERTEREAQDKRAAEFQGKVRAKYPDIDDRLAEVGDLPIHEGVQEAIAESQFGPEILNDLVSNPGEFDRLYKLSPTAAIREIGRMEARHEAAKTPAADASTTPAAPITKPAAAPAPIRPGGGGSPEDGTPKDSDDIKDWMRKEEARVAKLRKQGR